MNDRIKELVNQAGKFAYDICKAENRPGGGGDHIWLTMFTGKLSELIVEECAQECDNYSASVLKFSQFGSNAAKDCANIIREKLGVKK